MSMHWEPAAACLPLLFPSGSVDQCDKRSPTVQPHGSDNAVEKTTSSLWGPKTRPAIMGGTWEEMAELPVLTIGHCSYCLKHVTRKQNILYWEYIHGLVVSSKVSIYLKGFQIPTLPWRQLLLQLGMHFHLLRGRRLYIYLINLEDYSLPIWYDYFPLKTKPVNFLSA